MTVYEFTYNIRSDDKLIPVTLFIRSCEDDINDLYLDADDVLVDVVSKKATGLVDSTFELVPGSLKYINESDSDREVDYTYWSMYE